MIEPLAWTIVAAALGLAVWCAVATIRGVRPGLWQLVAAAIVEALLVVQAVISIWLTVGRDRPLDTMTFFGYHLTAVTILVAGVFWGIADRSRWGNGVFAIAAATEAVLVVRMLQVWHAGG